jgi:two-component system sensor histidine kinase/response regulator
MDTEHIHILVVDDLTDMADSTAEMLTLWGYDATACDSGAMALACARVRRPAAVLLDLAMPRMDGFEFARAFHAIKRCVAIPLIALSGYASSACSARAREAGIGHYLLKPAAPDRLRALLVSVTRRAVVALAHRVENGWDLRGRGRRKSAPACLVPACPF